LNILPKGKTVPQSFKVRKGKVGGYTEELSKADIAYINKQIAEKLQLKEYR